MKTVKTISAVLISVFLIGSASGQAIDKDRMKRDLKIAENIIQSIINPEKNFSFVSGEVTGNYVPDFGVIFSLTQNSFVLNVASANTIVNSRGRVRESKRGDNYDYNYNVVVTNDDENEEEARTGYVIDTDSFDPDEAEQELEENLITFLVDYADLIGQLKASDRIMIKMKDQVGILWIADKNVQRSNAAGKTAEILKGDLIDYKQGKISRDQAIEKVKFSTKENDENERDLELFSTIFARLYEPDLSTTYYTTRRGISYERIKNLGVIYSMRVYSSTENNGIHTIRTTRESGLTQQQRNEKVTAMYPSFEQSMKENVLDYGRTLRSLNPSEQVFFRVTLTECRDCDMPKALELVIKSSVLKDYDQGKISRDDALKAIKLNKTFT